MTEVHAMIGVMRTGEDEKKKVGLSIPEPIVEAFDKLCDTKVNGKEKWLVLVAALIWAYCGERRGQAMQRPAGYAGAKSLNFPDATRSIR